MMTTDVGRFVDVDGLRTFYVKVGTGTPLVMIHGGSPGACARVNWGANIDALAAAGFTVYAFDQPGYGRTDNPVDFSLEYRVQHAKAFIAALGIERMIVMGNSQGSYIAARIALEGPGVIEKLVLVSSGTLAPRGDAAAERMAREHSERLASYEPSLENMRTMTRETLVNHEQITEELVQERYEMSIGKNREADGLRRQTKPPRQISLEELGRLSMPALLMFGANDSGVAMERMVALFRAIPGAELHVFDHCGHWVQWDQVGRFNAIV